MKFIQKRSELVRRDRRGRHFPTLAGAQVGCYPRLESAVASFERRFRFSCAAYSTAHGASFEERHLLENLHIVTDFQIRFSASCPSET
jgi:hypothetical protein